jgi:hypothetical protein
MAGSADRTANSRSVKRSNPCSFSFSILRHFRSLVRGCRQGQIAQRRNSPQLGSRPPAALPPLLPFTRPPPVRLPIEWMTHHSETIRTVALFGRRCWGISSYKPLSRNWLPSAPEPLCALVHNRSMRRAPKKNGIDRVQSSPNRVALPGSLDWPAFFCSGSVSHCRPVTVKGKSVTGYPATRRWPVDRALMRGAAWVRVSSHRIAQIASKRQFKQTHYPFFTQDAAGLASTIGISAAGAAFVKPVKKATQTANLPHFRGVA